MINNKLLALFEQRCWHDYIEIFDPRDAELSRCRHCNIGYSYREVNPDYSTSPADRERLLQYLMGQGEMWKGFFEWTLYKIPTPYTAYIPWLFLPLLDSDIPRWIFLLQEWLELEETVSRFGMMECSETCPPDGERCSFRDCKVLTEWARVAKK